MDFETTTRIELIQTIIETNNEQQLKEVVHGKSDVNIGDGFALKKAIECGRYAMVEYLIQCGAKINISGNKAMKSAIRLDDFQMVELLIRYGAKIHFQNNYPIRWAARQGNYDLVDLLLKHGADLHAMDDWALQEAALYGHISVVKLLIENGANIYDNNTTTLRRLIHHDDPEVVEFILQHIPISHVLLAMSKGFRYVSFRLLKSVIEKEPESVHFCSDFMVRNAARCGYLEKMRFLIDKGANIHARNNEAMSWALKAGERDVAVYLLEHGARIFTKESMKITKKVRDALPCYDILKHFKRDDMDSIIEKLLRKTVNSTKHRQGMYAEQLNRLIDAYPWIKTRVETKIIAMQDALSIVEK